MEIVKGVRGQLANQSKKKRRTRKAYSEQLWLLIVFSLPAKRTSERVEIWRRLKRIGALPLGPPGYVLPHSPQNQEQFEWLAATIRGYKGQASVIQVRAIDNLPAAELVRRFNEARSVEYKEVIDELGRMPRQKDGTVSGQQPARLRRRLDEIASIDFFHCALRGQAEAMLQRVLGRDLKSSSAGVSRKSEFYNKTWVTRHRPGIDRVSSAWLIKRFIDPKAKFGFSSQPIQMRGAIPFDTFDGTGFTHKEDRCTFETLCREFQINDPKVSTLAQIVHDADLRDEKFGRVEGQAIEAALIGWAEQSLDDHEILKRGMQLFEGLYRSLSG